MFAYWLSNSAISGSQKGYRAAASYNFLAMLHFGNKAKYWLKMG
ncbi:hypothetical protein BRUCa_0944 [Brucella melitensis]